MSKLQLADRFIGRSNEITMFMRWLVDPNAPRILHMYDAFEESDKKGGIGKTWLLRRWAERVQQERQDVAVVMIDFFNIADRDSITIAERVISGLQTLYSAWSPVSFDNAIEQYRDKMYRTDSAFENPNVTDTRFQDVLSAALATDLHQLDHFLEYEEKSLLVFFDTFEVIEQNPAVAVLRRSQTFPDNYHFERIRVVIAGRNKLDWTHANWIGREQEILSFALHPFNYQEMLHYLEVESFYSIPSQGAQAHALYERTEGRPILIGLVIDVLKHLILTLNELVAIPKAEFEKYLVTRINKLANPLNWVILFMAHVYHHFNMHILEWILRETELGDIAQEIEHLELITILQQLSFVRQPSSGDDFVLHDEMRRLVMKYCWEVQDPDRQSRKEISRSVIHYYEQEITQMMSEQVWQAYIVEILYHRLFMDQDDGLHYFQQEFQSAINFLKTSFARLLLQEVQKFTDLFSLAQRNDVRFTEAKLLRAEENLVTALDALQQITHEADPQWYEKHQSDILMEEGRCYQRQSKLQAAANSFTQALTIEQARGNELQSAHLLNNLGLTFRRRGQFSEALSYYEKSIVLYKKLGQQSDYANTLTNISIIYRLQGKLEEALRRCKIAWRIRRELFQKGKSSELQVGLSLQILGQIHLNVGNIIEADQRFHEAYDIFLRANYKVGIAILYNRFGQVQLRKGELESAREWFVKAQEASREIDVGQYISSLNKQGRICIQQHKWEEAASFFEQAIAIAKPVPDYYQQTESSIDLADALEHLKQEGCALQLLQEAEEIASRENYLSLLGHIEQMRGEIAYRAGNYTLAFQHFILYCHCMADYNFFEFTTAVQKVVDALLDVPKNDVSAIVKELLIYWTMHQLDKDYPELVQAFAEVNDLMVL